MIDVNHEPHDLVVTNGEVLPRVCVGCGRRKGLRTVKQRVERKPGWIVAGVGWPVYVLAAAIEVVTASLARHGFVTFCMCDTCAQRGMNVEHAQQALYLGAMFGAIGVATAVFNGAPTTGAILAVAFCAAGVAFHRKFVGRRTFSVVMLHDGEIIMRGVHPSAMTALSERGVTRAT